MACSDSISPALRRPIGDSFAALALSSNPARWPDNFSTKPRLLSLDGIVICQLSTQLLIFSGAVACPAPTWRSLSRQSSLHNIVLTLHILWGKLPNTAKLEADGVPDGSAQTAESRMYVVKWCSPYISSSQMRVGHHTVPRLHLYIIWVNDCVWYAIKISDVKIGTGGEGAPF